MNLEKVILMGHSFGGFLAASYSLTYPEKVKHLILADPWGIPEKPAEMLTKPVSPWVKAIAYALSPFNPFAVIRVAGPWGMLILVKFVFKDRTNLNYILKWICFSHCCKIVF